MKGVVKPPVDPGVVGIQLVADVVRAARRLVKANGCLAGAWSKLNERPPCDCTFCALRDSLAALDAHAKAAR